MRGKTAIRCRTMVPAIVAVLGVAGMTGIAGPAGAAVGNAIVAPTAPTGVQVVGGDRTAQVSWSAVAPPPGESITRYRVSSTVGGTNSKRCTVLVGPTTCTLSGLKNGDTYVIEVTAFVDDKRSAPSAPVTVEPGLPSAPTAVSASIDTGRSTISFVPPDANGSPITSYTVTATDGTDPTHGGQSVTGSAGPVVVSGLTDGDSYTFTVDATNAVGTGPPSAPSPAVIPVPVPGMPTDVTAVAGKGRATVSFTPPTGLAESFVVTASDTTTAANGGESASGPSSPVVVTGLTGGDSYTFTVTAANGPVTGPPSDPSAPVVPARLVILTIEGSSSVGVAMNQWVGEADLRFGFETDWSVDSSVIGLNNFAQRQIDVAASDIPYSAGQSTYDPDQPYQYVPDVASGLGFMYNLDGTDGQKITTLHLDAALIAEIFLGEVTRWDDPAIEAANPQLNGLLPDTVIIPVYRSDATGENYLLSQYLLQEDAGELTAAQTAFESGQPGQPTATWPVPASSSRFDPATYPGWAAGYPVGEAGSDNVANYVSATSSDGSIGYVAPAYAAEHGFPVASVVNAGGSAVQPQSDAVSTALESATFHADGTQDLTGVFDSPQPDAYPLSSYSYLVTPCSRPRAAAQGARCDGPAVPSPFAAASGYDLGRFIRFLACDGQQSMATLGYAPLPPALVRADFEAIGRLNGGVQPPAPTPSNCADPTLTG